MITPKLKRADFESGRAFLLENAHRLCPDCGVRDCWESGKCSSCGSRKIADFLCTECESSLQRFEFEYCASNVNGTEIRKSFPGDICHNCQNVFSYSLFIDDLDKFVAGVPVGFQLHPEVGISTPLFMEIFAEAYGEIESQEIVRRRASGIRIRYGQQSALFKKSLPYITDHDTSDYGHDYCSTVRINPGPPYSKEQRCEIQVLLSRLSRDLESAIEYWAVNFDPVEFDENSSIHKILKSLERWGLDRDRIGLSLVNEIASGEPPGSFVNTFRLMEFVLDRMIEKDISDARRNPSIGDEQFLMLVRNLQRDLKSKLKHRVESLQTQPIGVLKKIWELLEPGKRYDRTGIFSRIARLRHSNVHKPIDSQGAIILPWEKPPFSYLVDQLLQLINEIICGSHLSQ